MLRKLVFIGLFGVTLALQGFAQPNTNAQTQTPRDGAWDKMRHTEKKPIEYAPVREADVLWHKRVWREIDVREKMNQPIYFPPSPSGGMRNLMQVILDGVASGDITPYSIDTDDFTIPFKVDESIARAYQYRNEESRDSIMYYSLMKELQPTEPRTLQRPTPPYEEYDTVITIPFSTSEVYHFRIKEDWFFDAKRSVLEVRILGICPVRQNIDPITGIVRGTTPLFWIYYPDVRHIFVNAPVYNRQNDAQRMSYDDLFIRRFFSSNIYKASNVNDLRISEYITDEMDALLEGERIKEEIRNFEHDLWEY
jgi:gliding motility associated protien GldN